MSDIPSLREKIQLEAVDPSSPASQFLLTKIGGSVNEILDGFKKVSFLTAGVHNWTCPDGLQRVLVRMCGGGGGGSTGFANTGSAGNNGGHGGDGALDQWRMLDVTPSTIYALTVGAGGAAGSCPIAINQYGPGGNGGDTIFDSLWTVKGANGGGIDTTYYSPQPVMSYQRMLFNRQFKNPHYTRGGLNAHSYNDGVTAVDFTTWAGLPGESSSVYTGGALGAGGGGGGGAGAGGNGGAGGTTGVPGAAGAGYGAGGGGGGGGLDAGYLGGAGASGFIEIYYV